MKRVTTLLLIVLATSIFAAEWYSKVEKPQSTSKDTLWYTYATAPSGWLINQPSERATYYNVDDFGIEYPLYLHAVNASFVDAGYDFIFKIYDKDGLTVLWDSGTKTSSDGINDEYLATSLLLTDDFWFSVTPVSGTYPRQFVQEMGQTPSHSYLSDGSGGWINQIENINDEDVYMENFYDIYVSEYHDTPPITDIYPPSLRSIKGTQCFMDYDMNLSIIVQDQNPVISPMVSQYSLDGGVTWTDFDMAISKENYTFTGTLPAQVDGTTGFVKFFMEDSLGNSTWSDDISIEWSKDLPMFEEDFENETFPPEGWSLNTVGAGWIEALVATGGYVHGGAKSAAHMDDAGLQDDWLITPTISIPATNSTTLTFWHAFYYLQYQNGINDVGVSTDGGTTFTSVWTEDQPSLSDGEFYYRSVSLSAFAGQDIKIGFHYTGDYSEQWFVDDIQVFYDDEGPIPISVIGNPALVDSVGIGAYLNNDLDITATLSDQSGIDSVMAHYSYDIGATWTDLPFIQANGEENWVGTIPAESSEITGIIYFDMVDIGGNLNTTVNYDFEFVADTDSVIFHYVNGTETFINTEMNLLIHFYDESAIDTCYGSYSKDGWVTQYDFTMIPAKIHEYTYVGTIPAETEQVLDGEVIFTIIDSEGNELNSAPYTVKWIDGQRELWEDFEDPVLVSSRWTFTGNWGVVEEGEFISSTHALTESPGGYYEANENTTVTLTNPIDFTGSSGASLSFWCKYDIEGGFDYMYLDVTGDNGFSWINLKSWDGEGIDWHEEYFTLNPYVGTADFKLRFRFVSDENYEVNGMYIDDIEITNSYHPPTPPLIIFNDPPQFYEHIGWTYTNTIEAMDMSGIAGVEVLYAIDGVAQDNIPATFLSENTWEFSIPGEAPGTMIDFDFWAIDNEGEQTNFDDYRYSFIYAEEYLKYDSGIVSYYNTTENGDAKAVRVTIPQIFDASYYFTHLLIRNYADFDHFSDDMTVRIWMDDGTGQPGIEVLTPITVTPEANNLENSTAMTLIDLRSYDIYVYEDIWIGFSSDTGIVYSTLEDTFETDSTAYNRSYDGTNNWDGTWIWTENTSTNYHFRAVLELRGSIEDQNLPLTTSLEQNYPNPFNPNTTINFSVSMDNSQIKLMVYNVKGELVSTLFDGVKNLGRYSKIFDASNLNSGVYYYSLEVNGVKESTKKMVLIK